MVSLMTANLLPGAESDLMQVHPSGPAAWTLQWQGRTYRCAVGRHGIAAPGTKREGDGKTPTGTFTLRCLYYRADKPGAEQIHTALPATALSRSDGWCDAPADPHYNTLVRLPFSASHETLWHEQDDLYDLMVPLGYNDDPVVPGLGSAIFFHVARPGYLPTAGCVAVAKADFLEILKTVKPGCRMRISE